MMVGAKDCEVFKKQEINKELDRNPPEVHPEPVGRIGREF